MKCYVDIFLDITNWFIELQSDKTNEIISKNFYRYKLRSSLSNVEQSINTKGKL